MALNPIGGIELEKRAEQYISEISSLSACATYRFCINKTTESTTVLVNEGDRVCTILTEPLVLIAEGMSISEIPKNTNNLVLQTRNGIFLRFHSTEIPEKKRGAVGVRGIKLTGNDEIEQVYIFDENETYAIEYNKKEVVLSRLKKAGRDTKGTKYRG